MFSPTRLIDETRSRTSRSSGSGGQAVNKLETRVEIIFNVDESEALNSGQKRIINQRLAVRINAQGELVVVSQRYRSQARNRKDAEERLLELLQKALRPVKKRVPTKMSKAQKEARLKTKRRRSEVKTQRRKRFDTDS